MFRSASGLAFGALERQPHLHAQSYEGSVAVTHCGHDTVDNPGRIRGRQPDFPALVAAKCCCPRRGHRWTRCSGERRLFRLYRWTTWALPRLKSVGGLAFQSADWHSHVCKGVLVPVSTTSSALVKAVDPSLRLLPADYHLRGPGIPGAGVLETPAPFAGPHAGLLLTEGARVRRTARATTLLLRANRQSSAAQ